MFSPENLPMFRIEITEFSVPSSHESNTCKSLFVAVRVEVNTQDLPIASALGEDSADSIAI
jgi:hypothetical protein